MPPIPCAVLQDERSGKIYRLHSGEALSVGRTTDNDLTYADPAVSRKHCTLRWTGVELRVSDLSSQGTRVNGETVSKTSAPVPAGGVIGIGPRQLRYVGVCSPPEAAEREPKSPGWLGRETVILREVGSGATGVVFEAHHPRYGRCAAKWLRLDVAESPEVVERFEREVRLQQQLAGYPGVVTVAERGSDPDRGLLFALMEFVDGASLHAKLTAPEGFELKEGVRVLARIARAVEHAHGLGIVHRDLKPQNVLLTSDGQARLTDFGLAKALECTDGQITQRGQFMGTPGYMAPEQVSDAALAGRPADVYGWGAMLYHLLGGRPPIQGKSLVEVLRNVSKGNIPPLSGAHPELESLCMSTLTLDPSGRPTITECANVLDAWRKRVDPSTSVKLKLPKA